MRTCPLCNAQRRDASALRKHMERDHADALSLPMPAPAPNPGERVIRAYMRVSTDDQDNMNQKLRLKQDFARRGWANVVWYEEKESGAKANRPVLLRLQYDLQKGDIMAFLRADRLSRSLKDFVTITEYVHDVGAEICCTEQPIDTTSPMGKAFWQILGVFAELERALIVQRTLDGMAAKRAAGVPMGRHKNGCGLLFPCPTAMHGTDGLPRRALGAMPWPPRGTGIILSEGIAASSGNAVLAPSAKPGSVDAAISATIGEVPDAPDKPYRPERGGAPIGSFDEGTPSPGNPPTEEEA